MNLFRRKAQGAGWDAGVHEHLRPAGAPPIRADYGTVLLRARLLGMDGCQYVGVRGDVEQNFASITVAGATQTYRLDRDQVRAVVRHPRDTATLHPKILVVP